MSSQTSESIDEETRQCRTGRASPRNYLRGPPKQIRGRYALSDSLANLFLLESVPGVGQIWKSQTVSPRLIAADFISRLIQIAVFLLVIQNCH